jgi:hypothetical protein
MGFDSRNFQELYEINSGGTASLIGPTGTGSTVLQSLVTTVGGALLAGSERLYEINRANGTASPVGSLVFAGKLWALANRDSNCAAPGTPTLPVATPTPTNGPPPPTSTATPRRTVVTTGSIGAADTTIFVADVRSLPPRGTMQIDDEIIRYDGLEILSAVAAVAGGGGIPIAGALLNVERGVDGTSAVEHAAGSVLILLSAGCAGDCDGDRAVSISELISGVNIALGRAPVDRCRAMDSDSDGTVSISELIQAVNAALGGCPSAS